jgi:hypothetical protein
VPVAVPDVILPLGISSRAVVRPAVLIPVIPEPVVVLVLVWVRFVPIPVWAARVRRRRMITGARAPAFRCRQGVIVRMAGMQVGAPPLAVRTGVPVPPLLMLEAWFPVRRARIPGAEVEFRTAPVFRPAVPIVPVPLIFHGWKIMLNSFRSPPFSTYDRQGR